VRLAGEGRTREAIAAELDISLASVYRVLAASRVEGVAWRHERN